MRKRLIRLYSAYLLGIREYWLQLAEEDLRTYFLIKVSDLHSYFLWF